MRRVGGKTPALVASLRLESKVNDIVKWKLLFVMIKPGRRLNVSSEMAAAACCQGLPIGVSMYSMEAQLSVHI